MGFATPKSNTMDSPYRVLQCYLKGFISCATPIDAMQPFTSCSRHYTMFEKWDGSLGVLEETGGVRGMPRAEECKWCRRVRGCGFIRVYSYQINLLSSSFLNKPDYANVRAHVSLMFIPSHLQAVLRYQDPKMVEIKTRSYYSCSMKDSNPGLYTF